MPLSEQEIDLLEELLFADELEEEALDYFGLHGLVCSSVVGPQKLDAKTLANIVFADQMSHVDPEQFKHFEYCAGRIAEDVLNHLMEGKDIILPHEKEEEFEACLESWCTGFMEGFFHNENAWFLQDESVTAELLLPIMALSGLFDSEEFEAIEQNEKLMTQFASIVGDQLTDIYLYYNAS